MMRGQLCLKLFLITFLFLLVQPASADQLIDRVDFVDASVVDVVKALACQAQLDVVISGNANPASNKRVTLHLEDVSAEEAIDHVLRTNGIAYEKDGQTILISDLPEDLSSSAYKQDTAVVELKYLQAEKSAELLNKLYPKLLAQNSERSNALVLKGRNSDIAQARDLLDQIDKPIPQILIESRVVEVSESGIQALGVKYGVPAGTYQFITDKNTGKTTPAEDLISTLNALITNGNAQVIATPKIATLDKQEALINIGQRIPYAVPVSSGSTTQWTVDYIDAGVKLKITPKIGKDGLITTFIQPEVSSISEWRATAAGEFPVITTRNAQSVVSVKNGETIVVGGLTSETERTNILRVPILGYIPLLGIPFQNKTVEKTKTEIVFLITPHLI